MTASAGLTVTGALTGTLATAAQPNVTSVGTLTGLTASGAVSTSGNISTTGTGTITSAGLLTASAGLTVTGALTGTLATAAQPNVTSVGTLTGLTSSGAVSVTNNTASTSTTSGALTVTGGVGVVGDLYVGGAINGTFANINLNGSLSSTLLTTWNTNSAVALNYTAGCWSPELGLFAITNSAATSTILTSPNGTTWTSRSLPSTFTTLRDICWSPELGLFMAVGAGSTANTHYVISSDGITWVAGTVPDIGATGLFSVCWSRELKLFLTSSYTGYVISSSNGLSFAVNSANWNSAFLPTGVSGIVIMNILWCSELNLVLISYNTSSTTSIYRSSIGTGSWSACTAPAVNNGYSNIAWSKELGYLVATQSNGNAIAYSTNGATWTAVSSPPTMTGGYKYVSWIPTISAFVAVGGDATAIGNNFSISYNATTWTSTSYTSTYKDVRSCIVWSPDLSLLLMPSTNTSSTYPIISSAQTSNSVLNIVSNTVNSISNKIGVNAGAQLVSSAGIGGTFKWTNTINTNTSNELMRLSKDGYLGINTKSPAALLHLTAPTSTSTAVMRLTNPKNAWTDIKIGTDGTISFNTSGTISGNANVSGINNLTASGDLSVTGTVTTSGNISTTGTGTITSSGLLTASASLTVTGTTSTSGFMRILSGTASTPASGKGIELSYSSTNDIANIYSYDRSTSTFKDINFNDKMRILASGNVGIGYTAPSYLLDVNGTSRTQRLLVGTSNTDTESVRLISALDSTMTTGARYITVGKSASTNNQAEIGYSHSGDGSTSNAITFGFWGGERMRLLASGNVGISTTTPSCRLDLGLTASNMGINLYGGTFGIGANNGFLNYYGNTSHKWWNTQDDVRLGVSQGTNTMTLSSTGDLAVSGSYLWTPGSGGTYGGFKFNVAGTGNATLQTFLGTTDCGIGTTSAHPFGLITNGSYRMYISSAGYVGIGTLSPQYPLHIASMRSSGDASYSYYYYLGPGSTNGSTSTVPANISLKTDGRILVSGGEIDIVSDIRMKENIKCLDLNYCKSFLNIIKPVSFNYKTDPCDINYGYIAQEIIKNNFTELITIHSDNTMEEFIDNDGFKSEAGKLYSVCKNDIIPILHTVIKDQQTKIETLEQKNIDIESRLARLEAFISTLEIAE